MKSLLAKTCVLLLTLAYPSLSHAQQFQWQCDGNRCVKVPVQTRVQTPVYTTVQQFAPPVIAATPATYQTFTPEPERVQVAVNFANYTSPAAASFYSATDPVDFAAASRIVSVGPPVVTSSTCSCATSGYCTCAPGTCACPGCPSNANFAASYGSSTGVVNAYVSSRTTYGDAQERVIYTPTGHIHVYADGSTMQSGGHLQRKVARQERWRAARGIQ